MAHHILAHRQLELVARGELISRGEDCVQCSSIPPQCHCTSQDQCTYIALSCTSCPTYQCQALPSNSSSGGVSAGAVAGAVVASVVFLVVVLGAFWFYRRRLRQRQAAQSGESKSDAPARAEDVLNRPDPNEKVQEPEPPSLVRVYTGTSMGASTMQATDGHSRDSAQLNPFNDSHSIQTTSTGTRSNVIPIALVPPATFVPPTPQTNAATDGSTDRTSALDIGVQGIEPSDELSQHTGLSNRSYASDLLNEAPVIVRPTRVVGVVKAEVIRTSPGNSPSKDSLRPPQAGNRPPVRSPLAASSFGPSDVLHEAPEDGQETNLPGNNPFGDEHSPSNPDSTQGSPAPSQTTFGSPSFYDDSQDHRPTSTYTQAASVIGAEIGGATRVHLGLHHLHANPPAPGEHMPRTASSGVLNSPRSAYRMTSAKLINTSPSGSAGPTGTLERQQQRAMEQITEVVPSKRTSMSSMVSTSTRADSILESFPFVPPSPISSRPIRTPPHSPLAQQPSTNANNARNASPAPASTPEPKSPPARDPPQRESLGAEQTSLPPPPRARKSRAMSVASQTSTMTNGLGSFPFQIDSGASDSGASVGSPPSSFSGRTRASLDTLALTSDLSSYPLNFDRSAPPVPRP
ncbi:hypothetical protein DAEQUDRAFT_750439 [Daedalea quercina L-15889]|uniref:Membrane anchor Opy2 N-terminal domain-containing protein n=1 Tax=Daedalea quercina L-15889 TaxID=1314783 RepID=A0A165R4W2_9APHY|nr:hypothetical protein DAEQUDRAFT_750439 [Daedalea quercina L-15889]